MLVFLIVAVVGYIAFRFFSDLDKDNGDLNGTSVDKKFSIITQLINDAAFNGQGHIIPLDKRSYNLYQTGKNQMVNFRYSTGHLTITWKYKYFQKEMVHETTFRDVRNLSIFEQQRIADSIINEMSIKIQRHQSDVTRI